jgi:hypothetical protein
MAHLEFSKEITALLVHPYNEFISAGPPSIDNRTAARIRTEKGRCRHYFRIV